jgi:hypothetical protein
MILILILLISVDRTFLLHFFNSCRPIEPSLAKKICHGIVDPITHEPFEKKANGMKLGGQTKLVTNFFTKSKPVVKPPPKIVASSAALKPFKPPRLSQDVRYITHH